jgi:hypothetical protein
VRLLAVLLLLASSSALSQQIQPVAAGQEFKGGYINVRVPNSDGWVLVNSGVAGMEFAKLTGQGENLAAQILMFRLSPTTTPDEFVALIKDSARRDTDPNRFDVLSASAEYTADRGYPCVRYSASVRDKEAVTSPMTKEELLLEMEALYCRHPVRDTTGFALIYSHRGRAPHASLKTEAVDFIAGIQVP